MIMLFKRKIVESTSSSSFFLETKRTRLRNPNLHIKNKSSWSRVSRILKQTYGETLVEMPNSKKVLESIYYKLKKENPTKSSEQVYRALDKILQKTKLKTQKVLREKHDPNCCPSWFEIENFAKKNKNWNVTIGLGFTASFSFASYNFSAGRDHFFKEKMNRAENHLQKLHSFAKESPQGQPPLNDNLEQLIKTTTRVKEALGVGFEEPTSGWTVWRLFRSVIASEDEKFYLREADHLEKNLRRVIHLLEDTKKSTNTEEWRKLMSQFSEFSRLLIIKYDHYNDVLTETPEISKVFQKHEPETQAGLRREQTESEGTAEISADQEHAVTDANQVKASSVLETSVLNDVFTFFRKLFFF